MNEKPEEFVPFQEKISVAKLKLLLEKIEDKCTIHIYDEGESLLGVSDGRDGIKQTVCFIEKAPKEKVSYKDVVVITSKDTIEAISDTKNFIVTEDPRSCFIKLIELLKREKLFAKFSSLSEQKNASIDPTAYIHKNVTIEEGVIIGKNCMIYSGVVLKEGVVIGDNCIIRENCVIGCDGIALYKTKNEEILRFPHIGGVYIGENVEIGSNCVIVRGALKSTIIGRDSVIGNLCNIGHGVKIGKKVWMSVGNLIGGNTKIGDYSTLGLGCRVKDNIEIGANVSIGMGSVVTKKVPSDVSLFGMPAKIIRSISTGPKR